MNRPRTKSAAARLPIDQYIKLQEISASNDRKVSDTIRMLVKKYIEESDK